MAQDGGVRVGFIGTGGRARWHMERITTLPEAQPVALVDTSANAIAAAVEKVPSCADLPRYSDYHAMLREVSPDAVIISIPHTLHYDAIVASLSQGAHVLVEKPMVCSVQDAQEVIRLRDEKHLVVSVGYQRHYVGVWRWVHENVAGGRFGPVHFIEAWQCQNWRGNGWRGVPELSGGGQLNDSGGHLVDILLWSTGIQPKEVAAYQENRGLRVDRNTVISFRFPEEGLGNISIIGESQRKFDEGAQIWCRDARIRIDGMQAAASLVVHRDRVAEEILPEQRPDYPVDEDANFIASILGRDVPQATAESGLEAVRFIDAVQRSAQRGAPVRL